jgi:hypothetical protein
MLCSFRSSKFVDCNGKQLLFEVKPGSDTNVLWKGTVRIKCVKFDPNSQHIEKTRELHLKQFLQVRQELSPPSTTGISDRGSADPVLNYLGTTIFFIMKWQVPCAISFFFPALPSGYA